MEFPPLIISKIIGYLSAFYDLVTVSLICRKFHQAIDLVEIEKNLPIRPLKKKNLSCLTDYIVYIYHQNPDRLKGIQMTPDQFKEKFIKLGIKNNFEYYFRPWENDIRIYYGHCIPLKERYQLCLEWKYFQIRRKYPFTSIEEIDLLEESIKSSFTYQKFLKKKYQSHLLSQDDFY